MSPVEIALAVACALLLSAAVAVVVTMRRLTVRSTALAATVDRLREEVEELSRREAAREVAELSEPAGRPRMADWVITFDGDDGPRRTASTPEVVSTTLGEPLIKVAALSHGVRQALREEKRAHLAYQVRREYRRRRRASRARGRRGGAVR